MLRRDCMETALLIVSILLIIIVFIAILGGAIMVFSAKKHLEPKTKYGEFPFSLTYKIGGNMITVNNTYVCKFTGIGWNTGRGFYKKWSGYVKETGLENVLLFEDTEIKIFCQIGDPHYYMLDDDYLAWEKKSLSPPHLYIEKKTNDFKYMSVDQIKQTYDIEIISWKFSNPIKNR